MAPSGKSAPRHDRPAVAEMKIGTRRGARASFCPGGFAAVSTVLVVDDDPDVLEVISGMLEELGCTVVCAHHGSGHVARERADLHSHHRHQHA